MNLLTNVSPERRKRIHEITVGALFDQLEEVRKNPSRDECTTLVQALCHPLFTGATRGDVNEAIDFLCDVVPDAEILSFPGCEPALLLYLQQRDQSSSHLGAWAATRFGWAQGEKKDWEDRLWNRWVVASGIDVVCAAILARQAGKEVPAAAERFLAAYDPTGVAKKQSIRRGRMLQCLLANLILLYWNGEGVAEAIARIESLLGAFTYLFSQHPPRDVPALLTEQLIVASMVLQYRKGNTGGVEGFFSIFEKLWRLADDADPELCRK